MSNPRGKDMEPWEAAVFAAALETLAITMFRDLYSDPPNPKQWALADDETKTAWRERAMEIMIDSALIAKLSEDAKVSTPADGPVSGGEGETT